MLCWPEALVSLEMPLPLGRFGFSVLPCAVAMRPCIGRARVPPRGRSGRPRRAALLAPLPR
jgi:hypothetical protein